MRHTRAAIAGLLLFVCATVTAQQTISSSSSSSGVYTPDQAAAGEKIYFAQCSSCHGDDLAGREQAPALSGASFVGGWNGKDLRQLLTFLLLLFPDGAPPTPRRVDAAFRPQKPVAHGRGGRARVPPPKLRDAERNDAAAGRSRTTCPDCVRARTRTSR